jgi:hypothetical protein
MKYISISLLPDAGGAVVGAVVCHEVYEVLHRQGRLCPTYDLLEVCSVAAAIRDRWRCLLSGGRVWLSAIVLPACALRCGDVESHGVLLHKRSND